MRADVEDFKTGWYQLYLGMTVEEIDQLIQLLRLLQQNQTQHFHLFSDYQEEGGLGEIELYVKGSHEVDNLTIGGLAVEWSSSE
jgi:hypothetical protein